MCPLRVFFFKKKKKKIISKTKVNFWVIILSAVYHIIAFITSSLKINMIFISAEKDPKPVSQK
jgi:uncharacterized membrane protein YfhO